MIITGIIGSLVEPCRTKDTRAPYYRFRLVENQTEDDSRWFDVHFYPDSGDATHALLAKGLRIEVTGRLLEPTIFERRGNASSFGSKRDARFSNLGVNLTIQTKRIRPAAASGDEMPEKHGEARSRRGADESHEGVQRRSGSVSGGRVSARTPVAASSSQSLRAIESDLPIF